MHNFIIMVTMGPLQKRKRYEFYLERDSESDTESDSDHDPIELPEWPVVQLQPADRKARKPDQVVELRWQPLPMLAEVNAHPKDIHIKFQEEGHKYWIRGSDNDVVSTTTLIGTYFDKFDGREIIDRHIQRADNVRYFEDPTYKYYRMDSDEILAIWDELGRKAAEEGTYNHEQIERYYNGLVADFTKREHFELFHSFHLDHIKDLEPFRTEMLLFHEELKVTGSADMLYRNRKTKKIVLVDWKFIKKLSFKNKSKQARPPLDHLDETNHNKYALQLSIYRYILETEYGYDVETQFLVILHKKQKKYRKVVTPYLRDEVEKMFTLRRQQLETKKIT